MDKTLFDDLLQSLKQARTLARQTRRNRSDSDAARSRKKLPDPVDPVISHCLNRRLAQHLHGANRHRRTTTGSRPSRPVECLAGRWSGDQLQLVAAGRQGLDQGR